MLTLLKFGADWCNPCKAIAPVLEQLDDEDDDLIVTVIDIDANPHEAQKYHVRSIPCLILIRDRKEIARHVGAATLSDLKDWISESRNIQ